MSVEGGPDQGPGTPGDDGSGAHQGSTDGAARELVQISDNPEAHRYELRQDGSLLALITYTLDGWRMTLVHSETSPAAEGRGLASRLAAFALDDARSRSLSVVPRCPFVRGYVERHPEFRDVVAPGELDGPPR